MTTSVTAPVPPSAGQERPGGAGTALVVLAVVLALLLVGFGTLTLASLLARSTEQRTATFSGVSVVETDLSFESLRVTPTDSGSITVRRSWSWSIGKPTVRQRQDGDRLLISSAGCGFSPGLGCTGSVRLAVPADVTLRLHAADGGITLRRLSGSVEATTADGGMRLSDLTGPLSLQSNDGSVVATGLRSRRVQASTSDGSLSLGFAGAPSRLTAHSKDGSITVTVPRDGTAYRVRVRTGDGSEQVSVPTDPRSRQRMDLTTGDGSIHVTDRR